MLVATPVANLPRLLENPMPQHKCPDPEPDDFSAWTEGELAEYAVIYGDNDDGSVAFSDIAWQYDGAFDVERLHSVMSPEKWKEWLDDEIEMSIVELEDPDRWEPLLHQDIFEPVVIVEHADGSLHIWDGWHRCAASVVKGAPTLKAVTGHETAPVPSP